jgi:DNA-binding NtrC family response regulator
MGTSHELPLPRGAERISIGSDPGNDVVIQNEFVSRVHCTIERRGSQDWIVRDRGSRNGTFVDGVRVAESQVGAGSRLVVGGVALALIGSTQLAPEQIMARLVGETPRFREAVELARRAARTASPVLILGESGTGKELFARLIHEASARWDRPFAPINCGAIAAGIGESELFGHERGAFTGAGARRLGVFEQADGGTLFLDEIGELPKKQQALLLRVLESRRLRRLGGEGEQEIDVRVVAATHRNLETDAEAGRFRHDLYHRMATVEIEVPALRQRPADIPLLVRHFLADLTAELGVRTVDDATMAALMRYPWPGNVRELRNAIFRAATLSDGVLTLETLLPPRGRGKAGRLTAATIFGNDDDALAPAHGAALASEPPIAPTSLRVAEVLGLEDMIKDAMRRALEHCGTQRRAAQYLGMARSTFHERARKYGLLRRRGEAGDGDNDGDGHD